MNDWNPKRREGQSLCKEIMAENFPNLMKYIQPLTQQIQQDKGEKK